VSTNSPPNPMIFVLIVAAAILKGTNHLADWWGIAVVVVLAIFAALTELTTDLRSEADALTEAFITIPFVVIGVFVGAAVLDTWWGVLVGGVVGGVVGAIPSSIAQAALERR
jgi:uncharacterized membrane protein